MLQAGSAGAAPAGHGGIALLGVGGGGVDGVTAPSTATTRGSDGGDGNGVEGPGIPSIERSERSEQSRTAADTNPPPASPPRPPPVLRILHDIWSFLNGPNPLRPPSIRPLPNIGAIDMFLHYRVLTKIPLSIRLVALIVYLTLWGYGFGTLVNMSNSTPATSYSDSPTVIGSTDTFYSSFGDGCGLNAVDCLIDENATFSYRCPANTLSTILLNPRIVGTTTVVYRPLVVGGAPGPSDVVNTSLFATGTYRADSFLCAAGIHGGQISNYLGGCATIQFLASAPPHTGFLASNQNGISSVAFDSSFPIAFRFLLDNGIRNCWDLRWTILAINVILSFFFVLLFGGGWTNGSVWPGRRLTEWLEVMSTEPRPIWSGKMSSSRSWSLFSKSAKIKQEIIDDGTQHGTNPNERSARWFGQGSKGRIAANRGAQGNSAQVNPDPVLVLVSPVEGSEIEAATDGPNRDASQIQPAMLDTPRLALKHVSTGTLLTRTDFGARLTFWVLSVLGFWHIALVSNKRSDVPPISDLVGVFFPYMFLLETFWTFAFSKFLPSYDSMPLERALWNLSGFWVGTMYDAVFSSIPIDRLTADSLTTRPGTLVAVIVIALVVLLLALIQLHTAWRSGFLLQHLIFYGSIGVSIAVLTSATKLQLHVHHFAVGAALVPMAGFATQLSTILGWVALGIASDGVARWGFDSLLQTTDELRRDGALGSGTPQFVVNATFFANGTAVSTEPPVVGGVRLDGFRNVSIGWADGAVSRKSAGYSGFSLLVDDVVKLRGNLTSYTFFLVPSANFSQYYRVDKTNASSAALAGKAPLQAYGYDWYLDSVPHYFRVAYLTADNSSHGDYTDSATLTAGGNKWIPGDNG